MRDGPTQSRRICLYLLQNSDIHKMLFIGYMQTILYLLIALLVPFIVDRVCVGHVGEEEDS